MEWPKEPLYRRSLVVFLVTANSQTYLPFMWVGMVRESPPQANIAWNSLASSVSSAIRRLAISSNL